ncbi:hypothetical protein D3C72_2361800 [compost metagenome]
MRLHPCRDLFVAFWTDIASLVFALAIWEIEIPVIAVFDGHGHEPSFHREVCQKLTVERPLRQLREHRPKTNVDLSHHWHFVL